MIGRPFSRAVIDATPVEPIPEHLIPWAKRDIAAARDEDLPKARAGLRKAEQELANKEKELTKFKPGTDDYARVFKEVTFLQLMVRVGHEKLEFYDGKIHLLTKRISIS